MKKNLFLFIFIFAAAATLCRAQTMDPQVMQQLSTEFMQLWQEANSARMAGEYDKAIETYEKCLDPKFESSFIPGIHAYVHMSLGMLKISYLNLKEEGRVHLEKAIEKFEKDIQPGSPYMATGNAAYESAIASCYQMLGDIEKANEHFINGIKYNDEYWATDMPGKVDEKAFASMSAPYYFYVGRGYNQLEKPDEAKPYLEKALEMYTLQLEGEHNAAVEMMLSYINYEMGNLEPCIKYYEEFLAKRAQEPFTKDDPVALKMLDISRIGLAHYYYEAEQLENALAQLDIMEKTAVELNWTSDLWRAYHLRGNIQEKLGDKEAALAAYEKAISVVEGQRSGLKSTDNRASFLELHMSVYRDIIRLLIDMGRPEDALRYLERSKARSFLDMLGDRTLGLSSPEEEKILEEQVKLQNEINSLTMTIRGSAAGETRGGSENAPEMLRDAQRRLSELMIEVKNMKPEFTSLVSVNPPEMATVQEMLDATTALVEFYPDSEQLNIWVMRADGVTLRASDTTENKLAAQIKILRSKITRGTLDDGYKRQAGNLYEQLIEPVEDLLAGVETLIIVPHGALHYLPFNMLMKDDAFLIDQYVVVLSPSSSTLVYMLDKENPDNRKLFALGDPQTTLNPLPAARAEVETIETLFDDATAYFGADAVETRVADAADADFVHVASHGLFYPDKPMFSALALSPDPDNNRDGFLQVHEIFGLNLKQANLVTLSACETGLAAITGGDDLVGLSRAFIYAGTPRVIVSLWSVNDASTGELMKSMYGALTGGATPAAALRQAQLELKNNPDFSHPFFWAPFQLVGDWR